MLLQDFYVNPVQSRGLPKLSSFRTSIIRLPSFRAERVEVDTWKLNQCISFTQPLKIIQTQKDLMIKIRQLAPHWLQLNTRVNLTGQYSETSKWHHYLGFLLCQPLKQYITQWGFIFFIESCDIQPQTLFSEGVAFSDTPKITTSCHKNIPNRTIFNVIFYKNY